LQSCESRGVVTDAIGPLLPFVPRLIAAVQLSHCRHSGTSQHFHGFNDGSAEKLPLAEPSDRICELANSFGYFRCDVT